MAAFPLSVQPSPTDGIRFFLTASPGEAIAFLPHSQTLCESHHDGESFRVAEQKRKIFYLKGQVRLKVLSSDSLLRCMGADLGSDDGVQEVFSPRGFSLLSLEALGVSPRRPRDNLRGTLAGYTLQEEDLADALSFAGAPDYACVWFSRCSEIDRSFEHRFAEGITLMGRDEALPDRPDTSSSYPALEKSLDVNIFEGMAVRGRRFLRTEPRWEEAVQMALNTMEKSGEARIMTVGGKGVGKSTLNKYLLNRLLKKRNKKPVIFVDLDPGQAEFTMPGCVSVTIVRRPVTGPNFCHVRKHKQLLNLYVGHVSVTDVSERYSACLQRISAFCRDQLPSDLFPCPVIINTMGFTSGLGLTVAKEAVDGLKPTLIVSVRSRTEAKNYKREFVRTVFKERKNCHYLEFTAVPETTGMGGSDQWGLPRPRQLRDLVIGAYLGLNSSTGVDRQVKQVRFQDVVIQNLCPADLVSPANLLLAMNCNLVALCEISTEECDFKNLGGVNMLLHQHALGRVVAFGIVKGVDRQRQVFYVKTPAEPEELRDVNCLSLGNVKLPEYFFRGLRHSNFPSRQWTNPLSRPWQRSSQYKTNC